MEIIIWILVGGLVGHLCGQARGRKTEGTIWGIVLGPIGWLVILCGKDARPRCPECGGVVVAGARKCQHCGSAIEFFLSVRCPACGEVGKINRVLKSDTIECPVCKRVFPADKAALMAPR
jgi:predicted RNA-binding Zn-ribbon protein involved in translation (DUF1610 family)